MSKIRSLAGAALVTLLSAAPGPAAQGAMSTPAERKRSASGITRSLSSRE